MNAGVRTWVEQQLDAAEAANHCVIARTRRDRSRMRKAVGEGIAFEVLPFAFVRQRTWQEQKASSRARLKMHALQELDPTTVFAGPSAALAHGLSVSNRFLDTLWVATNRRAHRASSASLRSIMVSNGSPVQVDGLSLTSFARTVGDCLRLMDFRSGLAVADSALRVRTIEPEILAQEMRAACWRMGGLKRASALLRLADARAESGGESIARATMLELGFAAPDLQRVYRSPIDPRQAHRVDFAWDVADGAIIGELDGFEKYISAELRGDRSLSQVIRDEHRRQSHVEACEEVLRVVRFGFSDVTRIEHFLRLLLGCGVPRTFACDDRVAEAGGILRCR